jgi:uncharacterized membrane protein YeaQ/YmgE (transglycosylase-associated protein family)
MELVVTVILGGVTGWLARLLVRPNVQLGVLTSVAVGAFGAFLGVALAGNLGLHVQAGPSWSIVGPTAVLSAAWLVGMLRATLGLFSRPGAWS